MLFEQFLRYLYSNNKGQRGVGRGGGGLFEWKHINMKHKDLLK